MKKVYLLLSASMSLWSVWCPPAFAIDGISVTLDNDTFVGSDNGYTNGLFVSAYSVHDLISEESRPSAVLQPLLWSVPMDQVTDRVD